VQAERNSQWDVGAGWRGKSIKDPVDVFGCWRGLLRLPAGKGNIDASVAGSSARRARLCRLHRPCELAKIAAPQRQARAAL